MDETSDTGAGQSERFKAIGHRLREARLAQGLSRSEVALKLHLPTQLLDDLEEGRMARLAPIYRRGYINNYAALLGIDRSELVVGLDDDPPPALVQVLPLKRSRFRFDKYFKFATYLVATIAIVPPLVMVYLNTGADLFDGDRAVSEATRTEAMPLGPTEASAAEADAPVAADSQRPVTASAMPLTSIRSLSAPEASETTAVEEALEEPPGDELVPDAPALMSLTLRLKADSWVEIDAGDDQRLEYDLLRADQELTYEGTPPLRILLGRASAVDLLLDGELLTFEGHDRGDIAELQITADGAVQR
jgi:cytoskeleton protein RodZ